MAGIDMGNAKVIQYFIVVIVIFLVVLPFINKPFHIDDWVFVTGAEYFYNNPQNPLAGTIGFFGQDVPLYLVTHPPFLFLYIFLVKALFTNLNEPLLRLFYLPFSLLAGFSFFMLAKRFVIRDNSKKDSAGPLYATLLFVFTPAFMVMSHSLMSDVPMLALFLAALTAYIYGIDRNNPRQIFLASVLFALTVICSYQGVFLFFLLFLYTLLRKIRLTTFLKVSLLPFLCLIIWQVYVWNSAGCFHLLAAIRWTSGHHNVLFSITRALDKLTAVLTVVGSAVFPLGLIYFLKPLKHKRRFLMLVGLTLYVLATRVSGYAAVQKLTFAVFFYSGILLSWRIAALFLNIASSRRISFLQQLRDDSDRSFLCLWYVGFIVFVILFLPQGVSRYLLPLMFPLIVLILRMLNTRIALGIILLFTLVTGFMVSSADYRHAQINKDIAEYVDSKFADRDICFFGEFGFRYYMEKKGYKYLFSRDERLKPDEIVVESPGYLKGIMSAGLKDNLVLLDKVDYSSDSFLVTMSKPQRTDFYSGSNGYGFLPYSFVGPESVLAAFNIYEYKEPKVYSVLSQGSAKRIRHVFKNNLGILEWRVNKKIFKQNDKLEVAVRWKVLEGFNPAFYTCLVLKGDYSTVPIVHMPEKWQKGQVIEETFVIPAISRNTFPGNYCLWSGVLSPEDYGKLEDGVKDFSLGELEIDPYVYSADLDSLKKNSYIPCFCGFDDARSSFTLTAGKKVDIVIPSSSLTSRLRVISFLAYASDLKQEEKVACVTVLDDKDNEHKFILKAGVDTAEWGFNSPEFETCAYKHRKADVYTRWLSRYKDDYFWGYKYVTYLDFKKPITPVKINVEYINPKGVLVVDDLAIVKKNFYDKIMEDK